MAVPWTDTRTPRQYRGVTIHPMRPNSMGCRWWAFGSHRMLQADTLNGMRELIRDDQGITTHVQSLNTNGRTAR